MTALTNEIISYYIHINMYQQNAQCMFIIFITINNSNSTQ